MNKPDITYRYITAKTALFTAHTEKGEKGLGSITNVPSYKASDLALQLRIKGYIVCFIADKANNEEETEE